MNKLIIAVSILFALASCKKTQSKEKFETGESAGEYTPEVSISRVKEIERVNINGNRFYLLEIEGELVFGSYNSWVVIEPKTN